jgi:hypothetical protein
MAEYVIHHLYLKSPGAYSRQARAKGLKIAWMWS